MKRIIVRAGAALAVVLALSAPSAAAQLSPLQLEVDGGVAVPTGGFVEAAPGVEGDESFRGPTFGVHFGLTQGFFTWRVGFSQHRLDCTPGLCEGELISTAWDIGARASFSVGPVIPWIGGGVTAQITEVDVFDPTLDPIPGQPVPTFAAESDRSWGLEGGAGLMIRLSERIGLDPAVRYNRVTPTIGAPANREIEVQQWIFDFGLVLGF